MAAECYTQLSFGFQDKLAVDFQSGTLTSDAGLVLLRECDEVRGCCVVDKPFAAGIICVVDHLPSVSADEWTRGTSRRAERLAAMAVEDCRAV